MNQTLDDWLSELAARTPTPGGGAAAALAAATSAALIGMVTSYTTGPKWADRESRMRELGSEAAQLRSKSLEVAEADAAAFTLLQSTYKLPQGSTDEKTGRSKAIQQALVRAANPPAEIADVSRQLVVMCEELLPTANPNVLSDVGVAASLARAALESAIINVEVNAHLIDDHTQTDTLAKVIKSAEETTAQAQKIVSAVRENL